MLLFLVVLFVTFEFLLVNGYYPYIERTVKSHSFVFSNDSRKEICGNKNAGMVFGFKKELLCVNERLEKIQLHKLLLVESCWKEHFHMQYPTDNAALIELYCKDAHPFVFKNVVDSCVIRKLVKHYGILHHQKSSKDDHFDANNPDSYYLKVINIRYVSLCSQTTRIYTDPYSCLNMHYKRYQVEDNQEKICVDDVLSSLQDGYVEDVGSTNGSRHTPSYCNDTATLQDVAETCQCLNVKYASNMSHVKECWEDLMYEIPMPLKENEWTRVLCNSKIRKPLDLIANVEKCILRKLFGKKKDYFYDPDRDQACLRTYFLKSNDEPRGIGPNEEQVRLFHNLCGKKNATLLQAMLRNNTVKCVIDRVYRRQSSMNGIVNYCWQRLSQEIGSKVLKVPVLNEDWLQFYCTEFETQSIQFTFPGVGHAESCFRSLNRLPSRSYYYVNKKSIVDPKISGDERRINKCLGDSYQRG